MVESLICPNRVYDTNLPKSHYFELAQGEVILNCTNFHKNDILW